MKMKIRLVTIIEVFKYQETTYSCSFFIFLRATEPPAVIKGFKNKEA